MGPSDGSAPGRAARAAPSTPRFILALRAAPSRRPPQSREAWRPARIVAMGVRTSAIRWPRNRAESPIRVRRNTACLLRAVSESNIQRCFATTANPGHGPRVPEVPHDRFRMAESRDVHPDHGSVLSRNAKWLAPRVGARQLAVQFIRAIAWQLRPV